MTAPRLSTLALGILVAVGLLYGYNRMWIVRGMNLMTDDPPTLWLRERRRADALGSRAFVITGTSRILMDLDPAQLTAGAPPYQFVELGISGDDARDVIANLADDPKFTGSVLVEASPDLMVYSDAKQAVPTGLVRKILKNDETAPLLDDLELECQLFLQEHFVLANPHLAPRFTIQEYTRYGHLPKGPPLLFGRRDRALSYDLWREPRLEQWRDDRVARTSKRPPPLTGEALDRHADEMQARVKKIEARGGKVVFFRTVTSGKMAELEDQWLMPPESWKRLKARITATFINYTEEPTLNRFFAVDYIHITHDDVPAHTAAFLDILRREGVIAAH